MSAGEMQTVVFDGVEITVSQPVAAVIASLQDKIDEIEAQTADITDKQRDLLATRDRELAESEATLASLRANPLTYDKILPKLDALAAIRSEVIAKARFIDHRIVTDGLNDPAIRRAAVVSRLGPDAVKDRSDDYVEALFDDLAGKDPPKDPIADAARAVLGDRAQGGSDHQSIRDAAYQEYLDNLNGKGAAQ